MTKKSKMVHIIALIILILEFIMFPLSILLFYWFIFVPAFGFSYGTSIPIFFVSIVYAYLGLDLVKKPILKIFTLLLSEKIKEMEKDDGRED